MCKYECCRINPVDTFGDTPLDNARMTDQRAVAALLEQAGALPGKDPQLAGTTGAKPNVLQWLAPHPAQYKIV